MCRDIRSTRIHRSQLVAGEGTSVSPDADLPEDRVAGTLKPDGNDNNEKERPEKQQEGGASRDVEHTLHLDLSITPMER
jgi:hypothetical protein